MDMDMRFILICRKQSNANADGRKHQIRFWCHGVASQGKAESDAPGFELQKTHLLKQNDLTLTLSRTLTIALESTLENRSKHSTQ